MNTNKHKAKKMYVYRSTNQLIWTRAGIPFVPGDLGRRNLQEQQQEQQNARTRKESTQPGRNPTGGRKSYWVIIKVDEDVDPAEKMTSQEMAQQDIIDRG